MALTKEYDGLMEEVKGVEYLQPSENQMKLLAYIISNSHTNLQELLSKYEVDIDYFYEVPYKKTALQIACSDHHSGSDTKCVELLIERGADVESALDSAAQGGNAMVLKVVLNYLSTYQKNVFNKQTIIELIKYVHNNEKKEADFIEVIQLLISTGININITDSKGYTAIYLAAKYKYEKFIELFLKCDDINLDLIPSNAPSSARKLIIWDNLYAGKLPYNLTQENLSNRSILDQNIRQRRQTTFIQNYSLLKSNLIQAEIYDFDLRYFYFCEACESGLDIVVKYLLCDGVHLGKDIQDISEAPLYRACQNGYYKVVTILLEYADTRTVSLTLIELLALRTITKDYDKKVEVSYEKCFELILHSEQIDINYCLRDKNNKKLQGKTALYFAIKNQTVDIVKTILRAGASLLYLCPWEVFLDAKSMIEFLNESVKPHAKRSSTKVYIASLLPSETDEDEPETKFLKYLATNPQLHPVLHHPVIQILLSLKWKTVRTFYDVNLILFLMFSITLTLYIILGYNTMEYVTVDSTPANVCRSLIIASYIILIFRELIQVYVFRKEYFLNYENYLEIGILSLTANILFVNTRDPRIFNQVTAILVILTAAESLLLIGRQAPVLFISINVLKTVSKTLLKWLFPYLILVFAFASSFYLLFRNPKDSNSSSDKSDDESAFADPYNAFIRTIVMLTGEFEVGNLHFETYPYTSSVVFIIYVFLMNTVLFGVCSALAFGETQIIMKNAEVRKEIYRIEHIAYWESMLRRNKTIQNFLKIEKLFQKNFLIIELTEGSKVYILNNPDPYKKVKSYLPYTFHRAIEVVCRDDLPYIIYLERKVVKDIAQLINERKQDMKQCSKNLRSPSILNDDD